jgi:hypothetical protein
LRARSLIQRSDIVRPFNTLILFFSLTSRLLGEVYYLLYYDGHEIPSKVAIDPEEPSLGRIRADSVPPPHSVASIKRCISRVERNPELADAQLFADILCETPLQEGHFPILRTDCPGLSPNKPMAVVHLQIVQMPIEIPNGKYLIKNRKQDVFWIADQNPIREVHFLRRNYRNSGPGVLSIWMKVNKHSPIIQVFKG